MDRDRARMTPEDASTLLDIVAKARNQTAQLLDSECMFELRTAVLTVLVFCTHQQEIYVVKDICE